MKKLLLSGTVLLLSLSFANAQGWSPTGAHDDFSGTANIVNGADGQGLYWFETTSGTTLALSRTGDGTMGIAVTAAGGCNSGASCYPVFGVNFGTIAGNPVTMDLSENADITLDITNTGSTFNFITVTLEDINGVKADFEPNVDDVAPGTLWSDPAQPRKSLNGFSFDVEDNDPHTIHLDLTNGGENVGGLTGGTYNCGPSPASCPNTSYLIDITKIKTVIFTVNFGHDDIFVSEGDGDPLVDTYIAQGQITPYTGGYIIEDFQIGNYVVLANQNATTDNNKLAIYPNPAKDILHVSYDASSSADITLTDMIGNKVLSTTTSAGSTVADLNTSGLKTGVYILTVSTEKGKTARRVSIQ